MKRIEEYLSMVKPADGSVAEEVQRKLDMQTKPPEASVRSRDSAPRSRRRSGPPSRSARGR